MDKARFLSELGQQLVDDIDENVSALVFDDEGDIARALEACKVSFEATLAREVESMKARAA
jgi:hypothetical protein